MNHDKDDVTRSADGLWQDIVLALTTVDPKFFNGRNQPCPICGGKDRARFIKSHELPFHCNQCGDKSGLIFYREYTGLSFSDAVNDVGDYLNLVPVERREAVKKEMIVSRQFPTWYRFDMDNRDSIVNRATNELSPWQRVNGIGAIDAMTVDGHALVPLLSCDGNPVDFVLIDADGNYQTTGGETIIPNGMFSCFGDRQGKRHYVAVSPLVAAHASIFMGVIVMCVYELENIWEVGKNFDEAPVVIVSNMEEVEEADCIKFNQMTYDAKSRSVGSKLYGPGEIIGIRQNHNHVPHL